MTSGSWVRNRRAALFPKRELGYPAIVPRKFPREPKKSLNLRDKQMTAMGIIVGGLRADSGGLEEGAEAEEKAEAEITERVKLGKLITLYVRCKERRLS